jgi:hypothetical protein
MTGNGLLIGYHGVPFIAMFVIVLNLGILGRLIRNKIKYNWSIGLPLICSIVLLVAEFGVTATTAGLLPSVNILVGTAGVP